jgi:hypothetical protein
MNPPAVLGFNNPYGVSAEKIWMMGDVVVGRIESQDNAEIIKFLIMVRQVEFNAPLCEAV